MAPNSNTPGQVDLHISVHNISFLRELGDGHLDTKSLFQELLAASREQDVDAIIKQHRLSENPDYWRPYGDNEAFFGVVENQQANPVPALVEKVTNGIDAILEKKVLKAGIDPRSAEAPKSLQDALDRYFPDHKNWDISQARRERARDLQIVASGPKLDTSLLIYDNGVGQAPEDFPVTFLSLLQGNKDDVHFVQGKYNMGGSGAVVFCGKKRYQLIASKRYDGSKPLGFTLLRQHPAYLVEAKKRKNTWYEYLVFGGDIPSLEIDELDLGLEKRKFRTGSFVKLYSYQLPSGSRSIISRDLNLSLNEFLFEPALPFLTVDNNERYPDNTNPVTAVYGLKRRLEGDNQTIEKQFSLEDTSEEFGKLAVTVYVFSARSRGKGVKDTKVYVQREYFKNDMSVLFALNGQVHGSFTSEFVTRSLKMPLLKDYVLIQVDCTQLHLGVRNELFMASRDRLKDGDTSDALRKHLRELLSKSVLSDIAKRRKANLSLDNEDTGKMLREVTRNLPMNDALMKILRQTLDLPDPRPGDAKRKPDKSERKKDSEPLEAPPFDPQRYPSAFNVQGGEKGENELKFFKLPRGGTRTISYATDVENEYFDRSSDPGSLTINLARPGGQGNDGRDVPGLSEDVDEIDISRSSPSDGTIKIGLRASKKLSVGDAIEMTATLSSPDGPLEETVLVKITDPEKKPPREKKDEAPPLGIPELVICSEKGGDGFKSWHEISESGIEMEDFRDVVYPVVDGDKLSQIIINIDSTVLKDFRGSAKSTEASELAERRYISAVYFHTLFLFATTESRRYKLTRGEDEKRDDVPLADYVADLFKSSYAQFLINFDTADLLEALG